MQQTLYKYKQKPAERISFSVVPVRSRKIEIYCVGFGKMVNAHDFRPKLRDAIVSLSSANRFQFSYFFIYFFFHSVVSAIIIILSSQR